MTFVARVVLGELVLKIMEDVAIGRVRRLPQCIIEASEDRSDVAHWAPRWRRLLRTRGRAPVDYKEFDRTVRGMLNRISIKNASRILPLEPSLRGAEFPARDSPPWWTTRFAGLMLNSYMQVIHTNRYARGLIVQSAENVLPGYLDAVGPLLVRSPQLVSAVMGWFARLLHWHDLRWMTTRLLLLAAREDCRSQALPPHALSRLPAEIIRGRILSFLVPSRTPATGELLQGAFDMSNRPKEEVEMDAVSVLAHIIVFSPLAIWRQLSAFGFSLVEATLVDTKKNQEQQVYLAASVLSSLAQRIEARMGCAGKDELQQYCNEDLGPLSRLTSLLREAADARRRSLELSSFVDCHVQVAIQKSHIVQEGLKPEPASGENDRDHASLHA